MPISYIGATFSVYAGIPASPDAGGFMALAPFYVPCGQVVSWPGTGDEFEDIPLSNMSGRIKHKTGDADGGVREFAFAYALGDVGQEVLRAANGTNQDVSVRIVDNDGNAEYFYGVISNLVQNDRTTSNYKGQKGLIAVNSPVITIIGTTAPVAPYNTTMPVITGSAIVGQTLTSNNSVWAGTAPISVVKTWLRGSTAIATGPSYVVDPADIGSTITMREVANNIAGTSAPVLSAATVAVTAAPASNMTAINANGWSGVYPSPPTFNPVGAPENISVIRSGYTAAGVATTFAENITIMKRLRQPYPNQATLTTDQVTLQDFVYASDAVPGVTNNSTLAYPLPVAMWLTPDLERITGSTFTARLAVAHAYARSGRPVAAVKFIATDGNGHTVEQLVSTMSSAQYSSGLYVPFFQCSINTSTLDAATLCSLDVIIYPWIGVPFQASINGSTYPSISFTVLKFMNDRTGSYGQAYAYVDAVSGNNATAVVSATPATAAASPYLTVAAAGNAIRTFNLATYGRDDAGGGTIRLVAGEHVHSSFNAAASGALPVTIEAANPALKSTTIFKDSGVTVSAGTPQKLRIKGITLKKVGASVIFMDNNATVSTMDRILILDDVTMDINGTSSYAGWIYKTGRFFALNSDLFGGVSTSLSNVSKHLNAVGCTGPINGTAGYNAAGCSSGGGFDVRLAVGNLNAAQGQMLTHCFLSTNVTANKVWGASGSIGARGFAVLGNVFEHYGGSTSPAVSAWADGDVSAVENVMFYGNTIVGSRMNWLYQDVGTATVHKRGFRRFVATLYQNTKTDVFGTNANLIGNWPASFNVGSRSNATIRGDSSGSSTFGAGQWIGEVAAIGEVTGTAGVPLVADWVDDQSFGAGGAGAGDYTPGVSTALPFIPAGLAPYSVDQKGRAVSNTGTARVGAIMAL